MRQPFVAVMPMVITEEADAPAFFSIDQIEPRLIMSFALSLFVPE